MNADVAFSSVAHTRKSHGDIRVGKDYVYSLCTVFQDRRFKRSHTLGEIINSCVKHRKLQKAVYLVSPLKRSLFKYKAFCGLVVFTAELFKGLGTLTERTVQGPAFGSLERRPKAVGLV